MFREKWTNEDLQIVYQMNKNGDSISYIGESIGRSDDAVKSVIKKINMLKKNGYKANSKAFKTLLAKGENQLRAQLRGY